MVAEIFTSDGEIVVRAPANLRFARFATAIGGRHAGDAWYFSPDDELLVRECFRRLWRPVSAMELADRTDLEKERRRVADVLQHLDVVRADPALLARVSACLDSLAVAFRAEALLQTARTPDASAKTS